MADNKKKTRSRKGSGCIQRIERQRKDGTVKVFYQARLDVGYDENGKRIQKTVTADTRETAEIRLAQLKIDVKNKKLVLKNNTTVSELMEIWIDGGTTQVPSTKTCYRDNARRYINPHLGATRVQQLTEADIRGWIIKLQKEEYAYRKPLSDKSVKDVLAILKSALNYAVDANIIANNPAEKVKTRKPERKTNFAKRPDEEEIKLLIKALRGRPHERFYKFAMYFGLREHENLGLTISDIDFDKKIIHLRYQRRKNLEEEILPGETLHFKRLKDHEQRDMYFSEEVEKLLLEQVAEERAKKKKLGNEWPDDELERGDMLFSNNKGSYLSYRTVYDCFKRTVRSIGLDEMDIHTLRHVYAVLAIKSGSPLKSVSEQMGHSSVEFTMKVYEYLTNESKKRTASNMNEIIVSLEDDNH